MKKNIVLQRPLNQIREGCKITHLLLTHPPNPLILIIEGHGGSLECKRGWNPFFGGFQLLLADINIRILLSSYCQFYTRREVTKKM